MLLPCYIILSVPEHSSTFFVLHDSVTMIVTCDIIPLLSPKSKIKKNKKNKIKLKRKYNRVQSIVHNSNTLT